MGDVGEEFASDPELAKARGVQLIKPYQDSDGEGGDEGEEREEEEGEEGEVGEEGKYSNIMGGVFEPLFCKNLPSRPLASFPRGILLPISDNLIILYGVICVNSELHT